MPLKLSSFALMLILVATDSACAGLIVPVSATGTGTFNENPNLLIDGVLTHRGGGSVSSTTVSWGIPTAVFIIDLGGFYSVENLTIYADNNDDYIFRSSVDGVHYSNLFTFLGADGPQPVHPGGQDILTTDPGFPTSPSGLTTAAYVGRGFAPVIARYLELTAARADMPESDETFGVGEVQAFGNVAVVSTVPEPSTLTLAALTALGGLISVICRRKSIAAY